MNIPVSQVRLSRTWVVETPPFGTCIFLLRKMYDACPRSALVEKMLADPDFKESQWVDLDPDLQKSYRLLMEVSRFLDEWEART